MSLPNADSFSTATSCAPCASGTYSTGYGNSPTVTCPYNATTCPAGTYASGSAACYGNGPLPNGDIHRVVSDWIAGSVPRDAVVARYGPIADWDTSLVTDMRNLFRDKRSFNANISAWQVGEVTNMHASTYTLSTFPSKIRSIFGCVSFSLFPFYLH